METLMRHFIWPSRPHLTWSTHTSAATSHIPAPSSCITTTPSQEMVKDWEAWCDAVHGVAKSRTLLSDGQQQCFSVFRAALSHLPGFISSRPLPLALPPVAGVATFLGHSSLTSCYCSVKLREAEPSAEKMEPTADQKQDVLFFS